MSRKTSETETSWTTQPNPFGSRGPLSRWLRSPLPELTPAQQVFWIISIAALAIASIRQLAP